MNTTACYLCSVALTEVRHADDFGVLAGKRGRAFCDDCSGCDRVRVEERCDACYADAQGHTESGDLIRKFAEMQSDGCVNSAVKDDTTVS